MKIQKHHITPRCLLKHKDKSFIDDPRNLVMLPYDQHIKAHKWLFMLTNDPRCEIAWKTMKCGKMINVGGYRLSDKTKSRMSINKKGIPTNIKPSKETRKKMSESNKNKEFSEEHKKHLKENNSKYWKGKHRSEETKHKISVFNKGKSISSQHKEKLRNTNIGKIMDDKTKEKIKNTKNKYIWNINGIMFNSAKDAGLHYNVSNVTIINWCNDPQKTDCYKISKTL